MFAEAIFNFSIILLGLSAASNGKCVLWGRLSLFIFFIGDALNVTISADPPLDGLICVDKNITFTCKVPNVAGVQYQWSIGDGQPKIGTNTYPLRVSSLSTITVTCGVYVNVRGVSTQYETQYGKDTVTVQPTGKHNTLR